MYSISNKLLKKLLIPKTLLARFMLIIIIPTILGQIIAVQIFYKRHWYNVIQHTSDMLVKEISTLLQDGNYQKHPLKKQAYNNLIFYYIPNCKIPQKQAFNLEEFEIFNQSLQLKTNYPATILLDQDNKIEIYLQINLDTLKIKIPSKLLFNPTTYIFVLWVGLLTLLLLAVSLIFSKNQIKSILELSKMADAYGRGQKITDYTPSGAKEIRRAGLAFLKMKERIERQSAKRTQMLAMISHDLRTPLTRMKLQIELMDNSEEKEELNYDIDSMQHMIASYLDFARGEGGESFIDINLNSWMVDYIKNNWNKKYSIEISLKKQLTIVRIKPHSFKRAIDNLISNALKHSTQVRIAIYSKQNNIHLTIEDNGSGISNSEKSKVFRPFYRSDRSRSLDNSTNVGLGLAITKEIIHGHYGIIKLEDSSKLKGLLVRIILPKTKKDNEKT